MRSFLLLTVFALVPLLGRAFDPAGQDDSQALVRQFVRPPAPISPPLEEGSFSPLPGETISLMGGALVFQMQDFGFLEATLQSAFSERQIRVRNLGWPGDTVFNQQRPMYFYTGTGDPREGSLPDQREKIEPGTFFLMFGRMESLDGPGVIDHFEETYEKLVARLATLSKRIVLVAPIPFSSSGPAGDLADARNAVLAQYAERIKSLAGRQGAVFVEIETLSPGSFAGNGMDLSAKGQEAFAAQIAGALGVTPSHEEKLFGAILRKNHLWDQYHRPTNWAFLFGDRQHVPSSRDHRDANQRWFIGEVEKIPRLLESADEAIWNAAKGGQR